jgi:hypothetical protein
LPALQSRCTFCKMNSCDGHTYKEVYILESTILANLSIRKLASSLGADHLEINSPPPPIFKNFTHKNIVY